LLLRNKAQRYNLSEWLVTRAKEGAGFSNERHKKARLRELRLILAPARVQSVVGLWGIRFFVPLNDKKWIKLNKRQGVQGSDTTKMLKGLMFVPQKKIKNEPFTIKAIFYLHSTHNPATFCIP
jgi:hypothetical protein